MSDKKPCDPIAKKPCEPEEEKKCRIKKADKDDGMWVPPPPKPPEPVCVEPMPPEVMEKVLFKPDSNDPVDQERIKCLADCHVEPVYNLFKECNKRVTRKILYTAETCHEETVDLMEALDKCVKSKAFNRLV